VKPKFAFFFLLACGGSAPAPETPKPHEETAAEKRSRELDAILKDEPKVPFHVENTKTLRASRECGQGPFRVDGKTLGTNYGEQIEVYACASHSLSGRSRLVMEEKAESSTQSFGWSKEGNDRCRASATELAHVSDAGATSTSTSTSTSSATSSKPSGITTPAEKLDDSTVVIADTDECPKGTTKVHVFGEGFTSSSGPYRKAGTPFRVEIWSDEPLDLKDVTFVLRQRRVDASMTYAAWTELDKKRDAWYARLTAFEKSHDDMFVHDDGGAAPSPPPPARAETQSPKPSVHAAWIPGYFHRDGATWIWVAGFWRVPDEDVQKELTTVAPSAPPPVRDESATRATVVASHDLVWTEGHWQWDGARWVWVTGAWRLPPERGVTWQAPAWRPRGATFIFVPGGWGRRH
jgi:hypothetical protein